MEVYLAILTGLLYTAGLYLFMHKDFVKLMIGLVVLGNATVLFIFTAGRLIRAAPPLIPEDFYAPVDGSAMQLPFDAPFADPLPQALILTALVIGFGVQAFSFVLFKKAYDKLGTSNTDHLTEFDEEPEEINKL